MALPTLPTPYIPLVPTVPRIPIMAAPQTPALPEFGQEFYGTRSSYNPYDDPYAINSFADVIFNREAKRRQSLNTIEAGVQYIRESFVDPALQGDFGTVAINTLGGLGETLDTFANPFKGAVIESEGDLGSIIGGAAGALGMGALAFFSGGTAIPVIMAASAGAGAGAFTGSLFDDASGALSGFAKGTGLTDAGRVNYDFDTGNIFSDIGLEVIMDPLNIAQLGSGAVLNIAEEVAQGSSRRLARTVFTKMYGQEATEGLLKTINPADLMSSRLTNSASAFLKTADAVKRAASFADDALLKTALYTTPVGALKVGYDIYKPMRVRLSNIITERMADYTTASTIEEATAKITRDVTDEVAKVNQDLATQFPAVRKRLDEVFPNRGYEGLYRDIKNEFIDTPLTQKELFDKFITRVSRDAGIDIAPEVYPILQEEVVTMVDTIDMVRDRLTQLRPDFSFLGKEIDKEAKKGERLSKVLDLFMTQQRINAKVPTLNWNTLVSNMRKNEDQFQALKSFLAHQGITVDDLLALDRGETTMNLLKEYKSLPKDIKLREVKSMRNAIETRFKRASKDYDTLTNQLLNFESQDVMKTMELDTITGQAKMSADISNMIGDMPLDEIALRELFSEDIVTPYYDAYERTLEHLRTLNKYSEASDTLLTSPQMAEIGDALDGLSTIAISHKMNVEEVVGLDVTSPAFKEFEANVSALRESYNKYDLQIKDYQSTVYKVRPSQHMARLFNLNMIDDENMQMMMRIADDESVHNNALSILSEMPALAHSGSAANITARNIITYAKSTVNYINFYNKLYGNIHNLLPVDDTNRILARVLDALENMRTLKPEDLLREETVMNKQWLRDLIGDITANKADIVNPNSITNIIADDVEQMTQEYLRKQLSAGGNALQTFDADFTNAVHAFRQDTQSLLSSNVNSTALDQSYTSALNDISTQFTGQPIKLLDDPLGNGIDKISKEMAQSSGVANPYKDTHLMSQIRNNLANVKQIIDEDVYLSKPELDLLLEPWGVKNAYDLGTSDFSFLTVQKAVDQNVANAVFNKELMPNIPDITWLRMNERYLDNLKVARPDTYSPSYVQFLRDSLNIFKEDSTLRGYFSANPDSLNDSEVLGLYYTLRTETGLKRHIDTLMNKRGLKDRYDEYMKIQTPFEKMAVLRDAGESQTAKTAAAKDLLDNPSVPLSKSFELAYNDLGAFLSQNNQINELVRSNQSRLKDMYDILGDATKGVNNNSKRIVTDQKYVARTRAILDRPVEEVADIIKHQTYGFMQIPNDPSKYPIDGILSSEKTLKDLGIETYVGPEKIYLYNTVDVTTKPAISINNYTIKDNFGKEYRDSLLKANDELAKNYHGAGSPIAGDAFIPIQANPTQMRELAQGLPPEVFDNIKLNEHFFDHVQYDFSVLGDFNEVNSVLNVAPTLDNTYLSLQNTLLKSNDSQIKTANLFFDGRFNADKFTFLDDMNDSTIRNMQDEQGMSFVSLRGKNKKGGLVPHVRKYRVNNATDLAKAKEMGAILIPTNAFNMLKRGVNSHRIESRLYDFVSTVMNTYKMSYLTNVGFVVRNFFDAQTKNAIEAGGLAKIPTNLSNSFRANRMIAEHTKVQQQIRDSLGGAAWNQKAADAVLNTLSESEKFRYELVNAYFASPASAGMAQVIDDMMRELNIEKLADQRDTFRKGLDMWNDKINNNIAAKQVRRATDYVEHGARLGLILTLMDDGTNFDAAIGKAIKAHFDYSTKSAAQLYAELIIPFITFPIHNFAYWMDAAFENPEIMKLLSDINEQSWSDEDSLHGANASSYMQAMMQSGNIKLGDYLIKMNPSVYDMFQLALDPAGELEQRLSGPLKGLGALGQAALDGTEPEWNETVSNLVPFAYQYDRMFRSPGTRGEWDNGGVIPQYSSAIMQGSESPALLVPSLVGKLYSYDSKNKGYYYNPNSGVVSQSSPYRNTLPNGWHPTGKVSGQIYNPARYVWTKRYYSPNIYKRMYTSRGNPRMSLRTMPPTPEGLSYRINDIRYMFR